MILSSPPPLVAALFSVAALLASALLIPAGPAHALTASPPSGSSIVTQCQNAYNSSSASQSCSDETFTAVENNSRCRIKYTCTMADGVKRKGEMTVAPDDADDLKNCNGRLQFSC